MLKSRSAHLMDDGEDFQYSPPTELFTGPRSPGAASPSLANCVVPARQCASGDCCDFNDGADGAAKPDVYVNVDVDHSTW